MKDSDFIIKQGWMVSKLGLHGKSLELYALVYGYTKDGVSWYETNIANIMEWLVAAERTVQYHLKDLVSAGYILRKETNMGRHSSIFLQANPEILEQVEKGAIISPIKRVQKTAEKGANSAPLEGEKGAKNDITPYIRIKEIKDNKRILLSACTRTKEEEEFFEIFFFRGAADPAAEVTDFVNWYEANYPEWDQIPIQKKYYYASSWKLEPEKRRKVSDRWLSAWLDVCNWIRENDPDALAQMLDVRFGGRTLRDPMDGGRSTYEITVTKAACQYLCGHHEELCKKYLNPLVHQHNAQIAKWNIIDKN